ncbi:MAG TPA: DUF4314 domain-containing protein [Pirellulaceae bacterium]|nr:DUF4314 domain-containing protein [Pirellulaceae bacterium]
MKSNQISAGTRIRLLSMPDDPNPIAPGTTGVVTDIREVGVGQDRWLQIDVDWDNGRQLMLASPPDRFEVITTPPSRLL